MGKHPHNKHNCYREQEPHVTQDTYMFLRILHLMCEMLGGGGGVGFVLHPCILLLKVICFQGMISNADC